MNRIFAKLLYMQEKGLDTVLATVIATRGSTPGVPVPRCW